MQILVLLSFITQTISELCQPGFCKFNDECLDLNRNYFCTDENGDCHSLEFRRENVDQCRGYNDFCIPKWKIEGSRKMLNSDCNLQA